MENRKFFAAIVVIVLLLGITACTGTEQMDTFSEEKTIVTIWTKDRHDAKFQKEIIREYNNTNTDQVWVEYKIFTDNYSSAIDSAMQNNSAPDIMAYTGQIFNTYLSKNKFADIYPFMDDDFRERFSGVMYDGMNVIGDKCYFIPTGASTCRLFYNKTLFEKAGIEKVPETTDEMIEAARSITQQFSEDGIYGFASNMKNQKSALDRSLMKQANVQIGMKAGYDLKNGRYDLVSYADLIEDWRVLLSSECAYPDCENLAIDPLRQLFSEGKIGMYMSYTYSEIGVYDNQFPMEDEFCCTEIPITGEQIGSQNYSFNNGYLFNADSENLELIWDVYTQLFGNEEYLKEYYENGLGISIVPQVIEAAAVDGYKLKDDAFQIGENDRIWPKAPHEKHPAAVVVNGPDMYDTFKALIFGEQDISESLGELNDRYNEAYQTGILNNIGSEIRMDDFDPKNP